MAKRIGFLLALALVIGYGVHCQQANYQQAAQNAQAPLQVQEEQEQPPEEPLEEELPNLVKGEVTIEVLDEPMVQAQGKNTLFLGNCLTLGMGHYAEGIETQWGKHGRPAVIRYDVAGENGFIAENSCNIYSFVDSYGEDVKEALETGYYDKVVVNFGTNSVAGHTDIGKYYDALADTFKELFAIIGLDMEIHVGTIPPIKSGNKTTASADAMSEAIKLIAFEVPNVSVLNHIMYFGEDVGAIPGIYSGGTHLSVSGYIGWYDFINDKIK